MYVIYSLEENIVTQWLTDGFEDVRYVNSPTRGCQFLRNIVIIGCSRNVHTFVFKILFVSDRF